MKILLLLLITLLTVSFLPYKSALKPASLRNKYVAALERYEGENYAPYGEPGGISCSTLVRQALIDTIGADHKLRSDFEAHPCSSDELKDGCNGELSLMFHADNLKTIDYTKLQHGDVAILGNTYGIHTLAYIGDKTWIHSDPITEKVIETKEPDENDDWTTFPVNVMRWNILKDH